MELDTTPRDAKTGQFLFNRSEEWLRIGQTREPDLAVDGLREPSLLARFFSKFLNTR